MQRHIENDYHNRIELCIAFMMGGHQQKLTLEARGIDTENKGLSICELARQAIDLYMQDFEGVDYLIIRKLFARRLDQKPRQSNVKAKKIRQPAPVKH